jgi:hypothetical protein
MPRRLVRYEHTGSFHFLTFSCFHRFQYLGTAAARDLFEDALERVRRRYRFVVAGYVVMLEAGGPGLGEATSPAMRGAPCLDSETWEANEPQPDFLSSPTGVC